MTKFEIRLRDITVKNQPINVTKFNLKKKLTLTILIMSENQRFDWLEDLTRKNLQIQAEKSDSY